jgi:hypothetical protein
LASAIVVLIAAVIVSALFEEAGHAVDASKDAVAGQDGCHARERARC